MDDVLFNYPDGAPKYRGDIKNGRMEGKGEYFFENGNVYVGQFLNNAFHGEGTIKFPGSGSYDATWTRGVASDGRYTFDDGLAYQETDWTYCTPEDRRYYTEQENINPAGRDQLTNSTDAARVLPRGCFDVGDGYLNPEDCLVYSWTEEGKAIRPAEDKSAEFPSELEWARANCREGGADAPEGLMETDVAAKRIQAIQRGKQARRDAAENKKAATSVQANFRGWKSRQSMKQKAEAAEEEEQAQAATKIAAMHRGKAARRERAEQAEAATKMQAIQRGRMARKGKEPVAIAPDTEVAYDPAEADAATLIQAQMRGRTTRREMKAQAEGKKIEEELGLTGSEEESAAIARMQAQQRGKMARKEMTEQQNAASKIAAVQRGKQDRQRVQGMKIEKELGLTGSEEESAAIARMQAAQRGKMSRKEMAEQQAAATKIAAIQRGKQDRKRVAGKKIEAELGLTGSEEETAAIAKMQAQQRGKMARKELAAKKEGTAAETEPAADEGGAE